MPPHFHHQLSFILDTRDSLDNQNRDHDTAMTETTTQTTISSSTIVTTNTNTDTTDSDSVNNNNNRESTSPPVSSSATEALSYLKQPMVVCEAAAAAAAEEASNNNTNTPPLDLSKEEEEFAKIDQSVSSLHCTYKDMKSMKYKSKKTITKTYKRTDTMYIGFIISSQSTPKNGVFTSDSSANLMVGCSGPLTPPATNEDGLADTTIMPHPHAQQV